MRPTIFTGQHHHPLTSTDEQSQDVYDEVKLRALANEQVEVPRQKSGSRIVQQVDAIPHVGEDE